MLVSSIPATLILPMMPSLGVAFSVDATQLGLLVGIYPLMSMLASPFWGKLSDRYGRKPILIITLLGGAAAFMCFALSTSWLGLFIGRALQGLAGTPRGIGFAVASDMAGPGERASGMGAVTAAMAIGFTVGPLMGGLLMGENPDSWLGALRAWLGLAPGGFSHVVPSLFGVLLNVGAAVIIVLTFHETWKPGSVATKPVDASAAPTHSFAEAIVQRSVIIAILFFLLSGLVQGSLQFAFALWANMDRGWLAQEIAWASTIIGLGFALGSGGILRPMVHRIGQEKTGTHGRHYRCHRPQPVSVFSACACNGHDRPADFLAGRRTVGHYDAEPVVTRYRCQGSGTRTRRRERRIPAGPRSRPCTRRLPGINHRCRRTLRADSGLRNSDGHARSNINPECTATAEHLASAELTSACFTRPCCETVARPRYAR